MAVDVIGALLGAGLGIGAESLLNQPKSPKSTAPSTPSQSTANTNAASTVADERATLLASGGETDYTGGLGVLTGSDVSTSSLIGGQ